MAMKLGASSYSWQLSYYMGRMTLGDCIAHLSSIGGTGFELIPEQMLPGDNFLKLEDSFVDKWFEWMEKYDVTPTCLDHFNDDNLYKNRTLTLQEQLDSTEHYLALAKKLGFSSIRVLTLTPFEVLERAIPMAEDYGVKLGLEIHAPMSMKSEWADKWLGIIEKTGTKYAGFIPDFGIFTTRPYTIFARNAINRGANPDIIDYIVKRYKEIIEKRKNAAEVEKAGMDLFKASDEMTALQEDVKKMGGTEPELSLFTGRYSYDNPDWLLEFIPYLVHVHAKFYEMIDDGKGGYIDPNIDTAAAVHVLKKGGYEGYLSSEYEAPFTNMMLGGINPIEVMDEREALRLHHIMLRHLLEEK